MTVVAIIQARMGATRLPGKVLMGVAGKPVLWHVVHRVSMAKTVDLVVVATTDRPGDDAVAQYCKSSGVSLFRGSESDVLDRYYRCAKAQNADHVVRITADCPLHDPAVIDYVNREYLRGGCDYATNAVEYTFPEGFDTEIFSMAALERAWTEARLPSEREHVTPYIRKHCRVRNVAAPKPYPVYQCSLDRPADLEFIRQVFAGIGRETFGVDDVVGYLEGHPEVLAINQRSVINEGYLKSLKEDEQFTGGKR
jgi:spore coat polysaccharide biosynthesis protein SpsF